MSTGVQYCISKRKRYSDKVYRWVLIVPAYSMQNLGLRVLRRYFPKGTSLIFSQERVWRAGQTITVQKLKTMVDANTPANARNFDKNDMRIVSASAHILRDLGVDESPQLLQVGRELSLVGPRPLAAPFYEYALAIVKDKALVAEWVELYRKLTPGITGPGQLTYLPYDTRDGKLIEAVFRADLEYYQNHASLHRDILYVMITPMLLIKSAILKARARKKSQLSV